MHLHLSSVGATPRGRPTHRNLVYPLSEGGAKISHGRGELCSPLVVARSLPSRWSENEKTSFYEDSHKDVYKKLSRRTFLPVGFVLY